MEENTCSFDQRRWKRLRKPCRIASDRSDEPRQKLLRGRLRVDDRTNLRDELSGVGAIGSEREGRWLEHGQRAHSVGAFRGSEERDDGPI